VRIWRWYLGIVPAMKSHGFVFFCYTKKVVPQTKKHILEIEISKHA